MLRWRAILAALLLSVAATAEAQRSDLIFLGNGDRFTGDLDWALEGFYRFDSDPISKDGDRSDYGITTLLKYPS